jgi:hypothetical protein
MIKGSLLEYSLDTDVIKTSSPKYILTQQGKFLQKATKNKLEVNISLVQNKNANLIRFIDEIEEEKKSTNLKDDISLRFRIIVPSLNNFSFTLFEVRHDILNVYPCNILFHLTDEKFENVSEEKFEQVLKKILNDDTTRQTLINLLSMID